MKKIIKEIKKNNFIYQLGYNLYYNKIYPRIEIYKNEGLLSGGNMNNDNLFHLYAYDSFNSSDSSASTIKKLFTKLRKYNEIPEKVEKEFESLFILYKLNNFNEY